MILAGTAPYGAVAAPLSMIGNDYPQGLIEKISCDIRNDDKQARCMQACDDTWIKATQAYNQNIEKARQEKKACDTKCGC